MPVGYVSGSGNEMSQTRWDPEGGLFIVMIMSFDVFVECRD